jgi:hypothetical protein
MWAFGNILTPVTCGEFQILIWMKSSKLPADNSEGQEELGALARR